MALSESPDATELKEVAAQYPDVEITRQDSLDAGNCESGTDDFIEGCLNGRTIVKVSELVEYIDDYNGVRLVLEYKFRQLESRLLKMQQTSLRIRPRTSSPYKAKVEEYASLLLEESYLHLLGMALFRSYS